MVMLCRQNLKLSFVLIDLQEKGGVKMVLIQDGPQQTAHEKPLRISGDPQKVEVSTELYQSDTVRSLSGIWQKSCITMWVSVGCSDFSATCRKYGDKSAQYDKSNDSAECFLL